MLRSQVSRGPGFARSLGPASCFILLRIRGRVVVSDSQNGNSAGAGTKPQSNIENVLQRYEDNEGRLKVPSQKQRQERIEKSNSAAATKSGKHNCKEAIDAGLELFKEKRYDEAIEMFKAALELPGMARVRYNSPRWFNVPSEEEENSAMYNMACCYAQKGQTQSALTCLEFILENNFSQFETVRTDPDLAPIQGQALNALLGKYDNVVASIKRKFSQPKDESSDGNKPWLMW